jgi:hypothetical protein
MSKIGKSLFSMGVVEAIVKIIPHLDLSTKMHSAFAERNLNIGIRARHHHIMQKHIFFIPTHKINFPRKVCRLIH